MIVMARVVILEVEAIGREQDKIYFSANHSGSVSTKEVSVG